MSSVVPANIDHLAEKNTAFLERINFTPGKDNPADLCNTEAYRRAALFEDEIVDIIFSGGSVEEADPVRWVAKNVAMVLVRPDMLHISHDVERFLAKRYRLLHTENITMDPVSYWNIYKHDLYRAETMHTRLTRAAMYIGSTCRLIIFGNNDASSKVLADDVHSNVKGFQGVYSPGTLRGDLVYREGIRLGLDRLDDADIDPRLPLATDMFGAYRATALLPAGPHAGLARPLLFYTGVGIHVPNGIEVHSDLIQFVGPHDLLQRAGDTPEVRHY